MKQLVESFINNGGMVKYCATTLCVLAFKTTFSLVRVNHDSLSDLALETWIQSYPSDLGRITTNYIIICDNSFKLSMLYDCCLARERILLA